MPNNPPSSPVFLGIDPGTQRVGYGVIRKTSHGLAFVAAGILAVSRGTDAEVLAEIDRELSTLLGRFAPQMVAVERLFFSTNRKTAIRVAEARGVILLALERARVPVCELGPNEVKLMVAGSGTADKRSVLKMVRLTLHEPTLTVIDDASDALALAICAATRARTV